MAKCDAILSNWVNTLRKKCYVHFPYVLTLINFKHILPKHVSLCIFSYNALLEKWGEAFL